MQVNSTVSGKLDPEFGFAVSFVHSGTVFDPGVGVGVVVGEPVGVGVGVASANVSVHAGSAAFGVTWGTVGATELFCSSFCVVRKMTAPMPPTKRSVNKTFSIFFSFCIVLFPRSIYEYFCFYR